MPLTPGQIAYLQTAVQNLKAFIYDLRVNHPEYLGERLFNAIQSIENGRLQLKELAEEGDVL